MGKRYYWLKLRENFFKQKSIKKLRKIAGGDTYTVIYLKLMLLSMKHDGCVYFEGIEDNFEEELSLELDEQVDNVRVTLNYLERHGLLEIGDSNTFLLPETLSCIGSESESAERVRKFRERKALHGNGVLLLGNGGVTDCNTEIEIERELEKEEEKKGKTSGRFTPPSLQEVTAYCNDRNNGIDAEQFINFYESKGWVIGKSKMKCWKAAVRTWEQRRKQDTPKNEYRNYTDDPELKGATGY